MSKDLFHVHAHHIFLRNLVLELSEFQYYSYSLILIILDEVKVVLRNITWVYLV